MAKFPLAEMALKMFCPDNVLQLDDMSLPSILVYIPEFRNSDVLTGGNDGIHPAFIVNGVRIPGFYYSKYQNVVYNGKAYSLPAEDPMSGITFDQARECCEAKGYGWHMSTAAEWAAIALWCKKNGFLPFGNNYYGKDKNESTYKATPTAYTELDKPQRVATGTGPLTWSHDNSMSGIWDMNGNLVEWQGGIRVVWGELQILANNDAADVDNPQDRLSTCWKAIKAADGTLVEPESKTTDKSSKDSGKTIRLDYIDQHWQFSTNITSAENTSRGCGFHVVTCDDTISDRAKDRLRSLALLPEDGATAEDYGGDYVYWRNSALESCIYRGGGYSNGDTAGLFSLSGDNSRSASNAQIGFRSAYIPDIG